MAIQPMNDDVQIIQHLSDNPNQDDGLSAEQMKEKFDTAAMLIKAYLNGTLVPAVQQLQKSLNNGDIVGVDDTLSITGQAADAKATGDALGKKADAIEDTEYPGCYYRMAGDVKEWISPPMVVGVEYQTTERWNGKTVFARRIYFGALAQGETTIDLGVTIATANMVRYDAYAASKNPYYYYKLPMVSSSQTLSATVRLGAKQATIFAFSDLSDYDGYMNIWYTKN